MKIVYYATQKRGEFMTEVYENPRLVLYKQNKVYEREKIKFFH